MTLSPVHIVLDQAISALGVSSGPRAAPPVAPSRDPPPAPAAPSHTTSELSALHRKLEAQMMGGNDSAVRATGATRNAYSRQGHVARQKTGQQPQERGPRRALGLVSSNTTETTSRKQQLMAYQEKKKQQSSRCSKSKIPAQSKVHAQMNTKKALVVAGGITRKDRYSDIYGHRQKLAAKQMR